MADITFEFASSLLRYAPTTGLFYWLEKTEKHCVKVSERNRWNSKFAGKEAFTSTSQAGYLKTRIAGKDVSAHRMAWLLHYGEWPKFQIDHVNGVRTDNRIENLRDASISQNARNRKIGSLNTSGHVGVSWNAGVGKWQVEICKKYIGVFDALEDAVARRKAEEIERGFHPNHGRAA